MRAVRRWGVAGGLALVLGASVAGAAEREDKPPLHMYAVILAEDESEEAAERHLQRYATLTQGELPVGEGYPRLLPASELPGLPEGRSYVVLGFCEERAAAQAAVKQEKHAAPRARVATTTAEVAEACPGSLTPDSPWELQARAWVGERGAEARRGWFLYRHRHPPAQCPDSARWRVVVREGERVLAQQLLGTLCRPPDGPEGEVEYSRWRIEPTPVGDATVLYVVEDRDEGGDVSRTHALWAYGCKRLVKKPLGVSRDKVGAESIEVEALAPEEGRPAGLRVTHGAATGTESPTVEEYAWSPEQCAFRRRAVRGGP